MNKKYIETLLAVQSSQQVIGVPAAPPNSVRPGTSSTNSYHTQPVWLKLHLHINIVHTAKDISGNPGTSFPLWFESDVA